MKNFTSTQLICLIIVTTFWFIPSCKKKAIETVSDLSTNGQKQSMHTLVNDSKIINSSSTNIIIATPTEYQQASEIERRMLDQLQVAVNAISFYQENTQLSGYFATIVINRDAKASDNGLILSPEEEPKEPSILSATCDVCGIRTAYACIKQIRDYMDKKGINSLTINVKRHKNKNGDDCVLLTYSNNTIIQITGVDKKLPLRGN